MTVNILAVGDISGNPGLDILSGKLRTIKKLKDISFTVVNVENAAVMGLTPAQADEILSAGADVITLGNHTWGRREIIQYLDDSPYILRPANFAPQNPGRGWGIFHAPFGPVLRYESDWPMRHVVRRRKSVFRGGQNLSEGLIRTSFLWTFTPRQPVKNWRWPTIWTAVFQPSGEHIPTCRHRTPPF